MVKRKQIQPDRFMKRIKVALIVLAIIAFIFGCIILFFELSPSSPPPAVTNNATTLAQTNATVLPQEDVEIPTDEDTGVHKGVIPSGINAGLLLQDYLPAQEVHSLVATCSTVYSLQKIKAGQPYTVFKDDGEFARFEYEIDDNQKLIVCREAEAFNAFLEPILYDVVLEKIHGVIDDSLFRTMANLNETPVLAERLASIFQWEINFIRDIQPGDNFTVLIEKRYRDGELKGYGKLLAAEFVSQGKKFEAYAYTDTFGNMEYFTKNGDSLKRAFLKAPLSFSRITSRFTNRRFHPVLQTWKAHPAVDYAAPTGTPVKAVGNAVATYVGWGKGAGNFITLKHTSGYESMYLHLSGFAKGLKVGSKVTQGQVIGFVGSTGYSTGPHLDFRIKKNGEFINPEKALSPRTEPVTGARLTEFKKQRDKWLLYLNGSKSLSEYANEKGAK